VVGWIRVGPTHEVVVTVAQVQHRRRIEDVDLIEGELAGDELEPLACGEVVEVVVVVAVPVVPAEASVDALLPSQVVIDTDRVGRVLDGLGQRRVLEVAGAIRRAGPSTSSIS
jgi:hypothetical protein